jgi:polysaccharide export outer membrane protein
MALAVLSACALPRGAALESEITSAAHNERPNYQVVEVTRASVPIIAHWPATGWTEGYRWLSGTRGPKSSVIRAGDTVSLVIWDSQDNSLLTAPEQKVVTMDGLVVSSSGTIFVPYVDEVQISGQTPESARRMIQERIAEVLPAAQVQLSLDVGADNSIDLVSGVASPGTYPLANRDTRILSAISRGGGIAPSLRNPLVRLTRDGTTYRIPAKDLFQTPSANVVLRGGDQIIVEEDERYFTALGASGTESIIDFDRKSITALEAMSMVGGVDDFRGNPQGVLILREYPANAVRPGRGAPDHPYVVFAIDLTSADGLFAARNFQINPKDTVMVTESPVTAAQTIFGLVGRIFDRHDKTRQQWA